jgi:hypothetical protein
MQLYPKMSVRGCRRTFFKALRQAQCDKLQTN